MMTPLLLIAGILGQTTASPIKNPYHETTKWRLWRVDETPVEKVRSLKKEKGKELPIEVTLAPLAKEKRIYPVDSGGKGAVVFRSSATPSAKYAGMWDDVYASWSNLHGYLWHGWKGSDGSSVAVKNQVIHFADVSRGRELARCGINFTHRSTTGVGHTITNGYAPRMSLNYEQIYFSDCLFTAPGHLSYVDQLPERCSDLYMALMPTLFHSLGSSNSETMAIDKMMIAGAYLPPDTKLLLKRHGLYPAAMLYLWKASLPYRVPYDHELRHRVVYNSVGDRRTYPAGYNHAGNDRGNIALPFHTYDDTAHLLEMIRRAKEMSVPPPEAILKVVSLEGGKGVYALKKTVLVVQEKDQEVVLRVSTEDCYDLNDRPLNMRWTLLYGNRRTTCERDGEAYVIRVPWDDALPEGRTSILLVANNGVHDSNPAVINVYRKKGDFPPHGRGYKDYKVTGEFTNRRPGLADLQDQAVEPGEAVSMSLGAIDPEGFPVRYHLRKGDAGTLDGNYYRWTCPEDAEPGVRDVTFIASDGTSGNSYAGKRIRIHISPKVFARANADRYTGTAPLKVEFSGKGSFDRAGDVAYRWEFFRRQVKPREETEGVPGRDETHTFQKPGLYTAQLTVTGPSGKHTTSIEILVTKDEIPERSDQLQVEGNGVVIRNGDTTPNAFDHTDLGVVAAGKFTTRTFLLHNTDDAQAMELHGLRIEGSESIRVFKAPNPMLGPRSSTRLIIAFTGRKEGQEKATVRFIAHGSPFTFTLRGSCK